MLLVAGFLLGGRLIRQRLLIGPDGAWRDDLWLNEVLDSAAAADTAPAGDSGTAVVLAAAAAPAMPAERARTNEPSSRRSTRSKALPAPLAINTCPVDSLLLLPGVGPVLALRIDEARRQGTIFRTPADLLAIKGIGPAAMTRLTPLVVFAAVSPDTARTGSPRPPANNNPG